jgi:hypothetical protein
MNWLVVCRYDEYCQGWDATWGYFLVRNAPSYEAACNRVKIWFRTQRDMKNPHDFSNHTVDID